MMKTKEVPVSLIFELRRSPVMLASDLAKFFDIETRLINQNIKANNKNDPPLFPRNPSDHLFRITYIGISLIW